MVNPARRPNGTKRGERGVRECAAVGLRAKERCQRGDEFHAPQKGGDKGEELQ